MEFRNLFKNVFKSKDKQKIIQTKTQIGFQNMYTPIFNSSTKIYENSVARECIDTIASHVAKLNPRHVKNNVHIKGDIDFIIRKRPNKFMNTYDFLYKLITTLYIDNISFIFVNVEKGKLEGLYPIGGTSYTVKEDVAQKEFYLEFIYSGKKYILPFENLIILRRFYNRDEVYGESNTNLIPSLETQEVATQGIKEAIKLSNSIKGIIKMQNSMLSPEDLKEYRNNFMNDYVGLTEGNGLAIFDARAEYQEVNVRPFSVSSDEMKEINNNIYRYFRISEDIIKSVYNEESWNSFYRSVIETIAVQLSMEFTKKIFTEQSVKNGHEIKFFTNTLDYTNLETKIKMIKEISALGLLTKNEIRETLGYQALEDPEEGNKLLQSLNFVDTEYIEEYQLKKIKNPNKKLEDFKEEEKEKDEKE